MNSNNKNELEIKDIITNTVKMSIENQWKDTGKINSGIYLIVNKANGKWYVGSSVKIYKGKNSRWTHHKLKLNNRTHKNKHLISAWHKYGKDNFVIIPLELLSSDRDTLIKREQKYLDFASKNQDKCYNKCFIAGGGKIWTTERHPLYGTKAKQKMSEARRNLYMNNAEYYTSVAARISKFSQMRKDLTIYMFVHKFTGEVFNGTRQEFGNKYNIHSGNISNILKKRCKSIHGWTIVK